MPCTLIGDMHCMSLFLYFFRRAFITSKFKEKATCNHAMHVLRPSGEGTMHYISLFQGFRLCRNPWLSQNPTDFDLNLRTSTLGFQGVFPINPSDFWGLFKILFFFRGFCIRKNPRPTTSGPAEARGSEPVGGLGPLASACRPARSCHSPFGPELLPGPSAGISTFGRRRPSGTWTHQGLRPWPTMTCLRHACIPPGLRAGTTSFACLTVSCKDTWPSARYGRLLRPAILLFQGLKKTWPPVRLCRNLRCWLTRGPFREWGSLGVRGYFIRFGASRCILKFSKFQIEVPSGPDGYFDFLKFSFIFGSFKSEFHF